LSDTNNRTEQGISPIKAEWDKFESLNKAELHDLIANQHVYGISSFFGTSIFEDLDDNTKYRLYLGQTGLGLPDKEYYFKEDDKSVETREEYKKHLAKMLGLYGVENAEASAERVFAFETQLANASMNREEQRDISKMNNKYSFDGLKALVPSFNWEAYFKGIGADIQYLDTVVVMQPIFLENFEAILKTESVETLQAYLQWKLINKYSTNLSPALEAADFTFYGTFMNGTPEMKPFEKRMLDNTSSLLGEVLGKAYVEKAFSAEAKNEVSEMVDFMADVLKERLAKLEWMTDTTKQNALAKAGTFNKKLGFPDEWKDFSALNLTADNVVNNLMEISEYYHHEEVSKLGQPIDEKEWGMPAHMVNAYYSPIKNEIVFPAGILQPPFFNTGAEAAVNYARMGAVIGHEMIHGYDDNGARFDADGNFKNWWTDADIENFEARTKKLGDLFSSFSVGEDAPVNGQLTMGENIADLGGLTIAYYAYQRYLDKSGKRETINGFTPEQRFFLSFAQIWKGIATNEFLRKQVATDPHSPVKFRVNGTLSNMPEFFDAFNITEGSSMRQSEETIARIW
jgi:putative endopeptidase